MKEAQNPVGDYIQIIALDREYVMIMDEDGKLKHKIANPKATIVAEQSNVLFPGDYIVGDVIICEADEI